MALVAVAAQSGGKAGVVVVVVVGVVVVVVAVVVSLLSGEVVVRLLLLSADVVVVASSGEEAMKSRQGRISWRKPISRSWLRQPEGRSKRNKSKNPTFLDFRKTRGDVGAIFYCH